MMIEIMGTILFYLSLNVQLGSLDTIIFLLFLGCCFTFFYYEYLYFTSNYKKGLS